MRKILLFLLGLPLLGFAGNFEVKIHVQNLPADNQPILLKIFNGNMYVADSLPVLQNETLTFQVDENTEPGMLRVILGQTPYAKFTNGQPTAFDILFNKENIELSLDFNDPENTLQILNSYENKKYFHFLKADDQYFRKLGSLEQVVTQYPDKDDFYRLALEYYRKFQLERESFIDSVANADPESLASKIIRTRKMPFTEGNISPEARDSIFKNEFLDKIDFTDTTLLYTNIYTDKLFQYINFFINRNLGPRENEAIIIGVLDKLEPKISANEQIRNYLLQFLISGFESMKMEDVLAHISNNYLQQCGSSMELIKRRLEGYKKMAVGEKVPDVVALDLENNPISLYASVNPYTLLIFWHTGCGHCQLLMNELPKLAEKGLFEHHNIKIISISIDEKREDWENYSAQHPFSWTNTYVEGSFNSDAAVNFNLFATPSMFLLDNNYTIIAKPITVEELKKNVEALK